MRVDLEQLGDGAYRFRVGSAREGAALARSLRAQTGVDDAWHTETHLAVRTADSSLILAASSAAPLDSPRQHALPVIFDGADIAEVARVSGLGASLVPRLLDAELTVSFVGFSPGFGYLRGLPSALHLPRRSSPRPRVPAGSVALAGGFAGAYPSATAGGWHLVGRTVAPLLTDAAPLLSAGDLVRLVRASGDETVIQTPRDHAEPAAGLALDDVRGLAFVEDGGRTGRLSEGVPPSGALVPSLLARANVALGNPPGAAGIERYGALRLSAFGLGSLELATDDGRVHRIAAGEHRDLDWHAKARAGYVAVRGGIDVPTVLGGRGTHVRASLGGHRGRALRRGDVLPIGHERGANTLNEHRLDLEAPIRVVPGPDLAQFAEGSLARLTATPWQAGHQSDRMGTRLLGGRIAHRAGTTSVSAPLVLGAIEVPPGGEPIVLGPEHPTTGGYPVVAVILSADLDAFHARPLGTTVRFRLAG